MVMRNEYLSIVFCLLILHAPDGSDLTVQSEQIFAIRPVEELKGIKFAAGTKTVIYIASERFGVVETNTQIEVLISECKRRLPEEQMMFMLEHPE